MTNRTDIILGSTGIRSSRAAFGVLPIQRIPTDEAVRILRNALDGGITFYDTARAYSDSEEKLGLALRGTDRQRVAIATKTFAANAEGFWQQLHTSLTNLKTDYVDIYQFHNPSPMPKPDDSTGLYEAMLEAKRQGKIRHVGITNHRLNVAREAVESGLYETLQFPFSYLSGDADVELVRLCERRNMGFIAMKALSGGMLTHSAAAWAWMSQFDNVLPIWGIQRQRELDEFLRHLKRPPVLEGEILATVDKDRRELTGNFCRCCGYCMPCPAGIQIVECARVSQMIRRMPSAPFYTDEFRAKMKQVESCQECGLCRIKCPYGLDAPALMRQNAKDYWEIMAGKAT